MGEITITLNGESRNVPENADLTAVLERLSLPHQRVAIELNGRVIRRADWPDTVVSSGDKLEVVHFVGGG